MNDPARRETQARRDAVEVARRAYAAMAGSFSPCPAHLIPSFRVWHYPAAGPQISWVIFHRRLDDPLGEVPVVRRLIWDRDRDLECLGAGLRRRPRLEPALSMTEAELDAALLAFLMSEAGGLALPRHRLVPPYVTDHRPEFGLEGFDVEGWDGRPVVRIEWDRNPPLQLEAVVGWTARVRDWLRQVVS